jgi:hypothetical protein
LKLFAFSGTVRSLLSSHGRAGCIRIAGQSAFRERAVRCGTIRDSDSVVTGKFPGILLLGVVNLSLEN